LKILPKKKNRSLIVGHAKGPHPALAFVMLRDPAGRGFVSKKEQNCLHYSIIIMLAKKTVNPLIPVAKYKNTFKETWLE